MNTHDTHWVRSQDQEEDECSPARGLSFAISRPMPMSSATLHVLSDRLHAWLYQCDIHCQGTLPSFQVWASLRPLNDEEIAGIFLWLFRHAGASRVEIVDLDDLAHQSGHKPITQFTFDSQAVPGAVAGLLDLYESGQLPAGMFLRNFAVMRAASTLH